MRVMNRMAVQAALSHADCIEALVPAMIAVSKGQTQMPLRQYLTVADNGGKFTVMQGSLENPQVFGLKAVAKYPRDPDSPYGSHVGAVMIFDADLGVPTAVMDGAELTAIRTSAASALATRVLSKKDARTLAILGTGTQAMHHIQALLAVRDIDEISVWGRNPKAVDALINALSLTGSIRIRRSDSVESAVSDADIVCTTTAAKSPVLRGEWLSPGCHVNLVGAAIRDAAEADQTVVTRSRFFTDYRPSAFAQAGELMDAIDAGVVGEDHIAGEIGQVLAGEVAGRQRDSEITTYKSLGVAAQDLAAALFAFNKAEQLDLGVAVDWH